MSNWSCDKICSNLAIQPQKSRQNQSQYKQKKFEVILTKQASFIKDL